MPAKRQMVGRLTYDCLYCFQPLSKALFPNMHFIATTRVFAGMMQDRRCSHEDKIRHTESTQTHRCVQHLCWQSSRTNSSRRPRWVRPHIARGEQEQTSKHGSGRTQAHSLVARLSGRVESACVAICPHSFGHNTLTTASDDSPETPSIANKTASRFRFGNQFCAHRSGNCGDACFPLSEPFGSGFLFRL
jgi:hypothetical protein